MTDLRQQAEALYERELAEKVQEAEKKREDNREQGIRSHIQTIQRQRDEERREQSRREAAKEAEELASGLHGDDAEVQDIAEQLLSAMSRREGTRDRLLDARARAGIDQGMEGMRHKTRDRAIKEAWFRSIFGGHDSLVGIPHELAGTAGRAQDRGRRTLADRDPLARSGTGLDPA